MDVERGQTSVLSLQHSELIQMHPSLPLAARDPQSGVCARQSIAGFGHPTYAMKGRRTEHAQQGSFLLVTAQGADQSEDVAAQRVQFGIHAGWEGRAVRPHRRRCVLRCSVRCHSCCAAQRCCGPTNGSASNMHPEQTAPRISSAAAALVRRMPRLPLVFG